MPRIIPEPEDFGGGGGGPAVNVNVLSLPSTPAGNNIIGQVKITDGTDIVDVLDLPNNNPLTVALVDANGDQITSFAGTQYTEDVPSVADPTGIMGMAVRADTLGSITSANGDNIALRATNRGELYVKHADAIPVTDNGGSLTVDGAVTANAGTDLNTSLLALESGGNLAAAATSLSVIDDWDESDRAKVNLIVGQAGVQGGSGVVTTNTQRVTLATDVALPAGTNTLGAVRITDGTDLLEIETDGAIRTRLYDASGNDIATDSTGRLIPSWMGANATTAGLRTGSVQLTVAATWAKIINTVYVEQSVNAQRSFVSTNASDSSVGTGIRSIRLTYLNAAGSVFTENIILSGTTPVNTTAINICYIEKMEAIDVGTGGVAAGIISLMTGTGGGGTTIWSIAIGATKTYGAHHYTPTGTTTKITSMTCGSDGTGANSGARYVLRSFAVPSGNAVEAEVSDIFHVGGQMGSQKRTFDTPIMVSGLARTTVYVSPDSATTIVYRGTIDFFEE